MCQWESQPALPDHIALDKKYQVKLQPLLSGSFDGRHPQSEN
jgi:hypothetical protein